MDATETHFSLRSRLHGPVPPEWSQPPTAAGSTVVDDPFAGDDEPWAVDWIGDLAHRHDVDEEPAEHFFAGLVIGLGLSTLAWVTIAVAALHVYRLLT